ncbi:hypothetical protein IKG31_01705 [Candidatus Saccharibacteria bacterium]|nr:hypothetical protein [Candidatus Saccharibacteria bacterium]
MHKFKTFISGSLLLLLTFLSGALLSSPNTHAEESDMGFNVVVPTSCSLSANNVSLSETINPGQSKSIGTAKINAVCNDPNGLAIYAVGYTDDTYGKDVLTTDLTTPDHSYDIPTNTNSEGDAESGWSMQVVNDDDQANYDATIVDNFNNPHIIPKTYSKIASRTAHTDLITGTNLDISFNAYISTTQPASTYRGKVKFTLVHPSVHTAPETPVATPGQICYYGNGADEGSMACQTTIDINRSTIALSANAEAQLRASNFSRAGYGFTGWNTKEDGTGTQYGPMETIVFTEDMNADGLMLFANWKAAETGVTMQTFDASVSPYSTMPNNTVIALRDERDDDVYAVAKLADGNWWMIENLRLDYDANITISNTQSNNNGAFGGVFAGLAEPESTNFNDVTTANSLYTTDTSSTSLQIITGSNQGYRFPRYNNSNTASRTANNTTSDTNVYGYGNYYTWSAAVADTTAYSTYNQSVTSTSLCPSGWHLPTGGTADTTDLKALNTAVNSGSTSSSTGLRAYPTNLLYSGLYDSSSAHNRGVNGDYWSSTVFNSGDAYYECPLSSFVVPGTREISKYYGLTVRCLADIPASSSEPTNPTNNDPSSPSSDPSTPTNSPTNAPSNSPSYSSQSYNPQTTNRSSSNQTDELDKNVNKKDDTKSTSAKSTSTEPLGVKNSREDTENIARVGGNGAEVYGTIAIAGAAALGAAGLFFLAGKRRKDDEEEEK